MPRRVAGVARPRGVVSTVRPVKPPSGTKRPGGLKRYAANRHPVLLGGPGEPRRGFLRGTNSREEWPIYWACEKYFKEKAGGIWNYQITVGSNLPGGSKPDFVINYKRPIIMRVQSDRYHVQVSSWRAAYDIQQRIELEKRGFTVIDVFPQYYMIDDMGPLTGQAAIATVAEAAAGRQKADPRSGQTSWARG